MSSSYSANQYDSAFRSHRLQNWCETKHFKQRPSAQQGQTTFIANDRGHLLPGVMKRGSAWPDFKGTWDLPARIPARSINPTGRSVAGLSRLMSWGFDLQHTDASLPHGGSRDTHRLQDGREQTNVDVEQDGAAPHSAASQHCPISGGERPASRNLDLQATVVGSVGQPAEEKQATRTDRTLSQCSAADEEPALRPAAAAAAAAAAGGEEANSRLNTGRGSTASNVAEKAASQRASSSSKQRILHRDAQTDQ